MSSAIATGYIRSAGADWWWFVSLPLVAVLVALGFHHYLPYMAQVSVAVWVTIPHHYAGWVRSYGLEEDWTRWRNRLMFGPALVILAVLLGSAFIPVSVALVLLLWDHQHSVMQQHGFARVYDFKAGTGTPTQRRLDFWLSMALYGNLLITAPLWSELWIAELFRWDLQMSAASIRAFQTTSWSLTGAFLVFYLLYTGANVARGQRINPMKYLFLGSSYALWYYVSWQDSFLVYTVAHRLMHGLQYIVFVYWYMGRKTQATGQPVRLLRHFTLPRFLLVGLVYAVVFQLAFGSGVDEFSFGLVQMLQEDEFLQFSREKAAGFYAATAVSAAAAAHYYVDSFIWKVSDSGTQKGL